MDNSYLRLCTCLYIFTQIWMPYLVLLEILFQAVVSSLQSLLAFGSACKEQ